jgi:hypothetical protein
MIRATIRIVKTTEYIKTDFCFINSRHPQSSHIETVILNRNVSIDTRERISCRLKGFAGITLKNHTMLTSIIQQLPCRFLLPPSPDQISRSPE